MRKLLVDTSVIIDFQRRKDIDNTLFYNIAHQDLYISILSHTELYSGSSVWKSKKVRKEVEDLLEGVNILPLTVGISEIAGKLRYSSGLGMADCIIAATALDENLELATLNLKHFSKVKNLVLYKSE